MITLLLLWPLYVSTATALLANGHDHCIDQRPQQCVHFRPIGHCLWINSSRDIESRTLYVTIHHELFSGRIRYNIFSEIVAFKAIPVWWRWSIRCMICATLYIFLQSYSIITKRGK